MSGMTTRRTGAAPEPAFETLRDSYLERCDTVLWSLAPGGMVLHNVVSGLYLELDPLGYRVWGLLDGAHSASEIRRICAVGTPDCAGMQARVDQIIETLLQYGYVEARDHG